MAKILIVEDEPHMQMGLQDNLEFEGYQVDTASNGQEAFDKIVAATYQLVLLDVMLPRLSGYDVCKMVRKKGLQVPIIMLTARGEEIDKVRGLELGADDYVTKPFGLGELLARIKAVLRRGTASESTAEAPSTVNIGLLKADFASCRAEKGGKEVKMSHREFAVLQYLWQNRNRVVSRDDLLSNIWGYGDSPTTRTVDNFILKLRHKLEEDPNQPRTIITVHGTGYKLLM